MSSAYIVYTRGVLKMKAHSKNESIFQNYSNLRKVTAKVTAEVTIEVTTEVTTEVTIEVTITELNLILN